MKKLWDYEDFVGFLTHPDRAVRRWAFEIVEKRFPRRFTPEAAKLVGDPDDYLACMAPGYLAGHNAVEFAPSILDCMLKRQGNVRSNCAKALGKMAWKPAFDPVMELLSSGEGATCPGCLRYLGSIHDDDCHLALREFFDHVQDEFLKEAAAEELLRHLQNEDIGALYDYVFGDSGESWAKESLFSKLPGVIQAQNLFDDLSEDNGTSILNDPVGRIVEALKANSTLLPEPHLIDKIGMLISSKRYADIASVLIPEAGSIIGSRYPDYGSMDLLSEIFDSDTFALGLLEEFVRRPFKFPTGKRKREILISTLCACYFSIIHREAYVPALSPEATEDDLIWALKAAGDQFPESLQKRIVELAPISALKAALTPDHSTWGAIWTVRIMGRIGSPAFIPDLVHVLNESDGLDFVHEEAFQALNGIDETGHEDLLAAVREGLVTDEIDALGLLEHLPYPEAFDAARELYGEQKYEESELYGIALEGIGDSRGIDDLLEVYRKYREFPIGESLEILCLIHKQEIPELQTIRRRREEDKARGDVPFLPGKSFTGSSSGGAFPAGKARRSEKEDDPPLHYKQELSPVRVEKIGRNRPCPCGSGKKYKKCCLDKK